MCTRLLYRKISAAVFCIPSMWHCLQMLLQPRIMQNDTWTRHKSLEDFLWPAPFQHFLAICLAAVGSRVLEREMLGLDPVRQLFSFPSCKCTGFQVLGICKFHSEEWKLLFHGSFLPSSVMLCFLWWLRMFISHLSPWQQQHHFTLWTCQIFFFHYIAATIFFSGQGLFFLSSTLSDLTSCHPIAQGRMCSCRHLSFKVKLNLKSFI